MGHRGGVRAAVNNVDRIIELYNRLTLREVAELRRRFGWGDTSSGVREPRRPFPPDLPAHAVPDAIPEDEQ